MRVSLNKSELISGGSIQITGSKSESNRLLILQALYPKLEIKNLSNSDDTAVMVKALSSEESLIDIHHAGTAMRFLTAYFATQKGREVILTGSDRMKERPIAILVQTLQKIGAEIEYLDENGFPPLKITGKTITDDKVEIKANISSQYITALLLIAPKLKHGLCLNLTGELTSRPYVNMTLDLLKSIGVDCNHDHNHIHVRPMPELNQKIQLTVESDWSSASYYFSMVALSAIGKKVRLRSYKTNSLQGDSILPELYQPLGVETRFEQDELILTKISEPKENSIEVDMRSCPDLAQTLAVSCLGLGIGCNLTGLHTLKIKETDRLVALKNEMEKCGATVNITNASLHLPSGAKLIADAVISTYNDHRMAMAFAPLALKTSIAIEEADVVSKSYPGFWSDLKALGFHLKSA
ncbi:MAG: 3-phosphoshikimate 1-carboxyvinyltransferase [Flavobacteriaceae bacterium]|nr:3-phosphoshikimate 1-carboxyvinyltransferase [Bacteroidia bacterium]NNF75653.1 3-phosphoshikimate 1-carboxyvinyltransferase [Flavobacteriaceae bacterium]NNK71641.1 3-phosphoshikimate 1-carboxyvinyltransferase [Flavobacteriaceae bacterium]